MIGHSTGAVIHHLSGSSVSVEADVSSGLPQFHIVGLPDSAVNESKLRIRSAIKNSGLHFPTGRITVNLSPASLRKRGAGLDLAIAIAILRASGQIPNDESRPVGLCGELSLSGEIVPVHGVISLALALLMDGIPNSIVSSRQQSQCISIPGFSWFPMRSLLEVVHAFRTQTYPTSFKLDSTAVVEPTDLDFADVSGMSGEKRLLIASAIGSHHALLVGPPGCGKTMMVERVSSILPDLEQHRALEVYAIHELSGHQDSPSLRPPLRMPHHSLTPVGMIGGGSTLAPGEATLAHNGVLVLDELLEFARTTLDTLREPLIHGRILLTRNGQSVQLPARFQLLGTLNPCPCGHYGFGECRCPMSTVSRYWARLSGALLDRMDLLIHVKPHTGVEVSEHGPTSKDLRSAVAEGQKEFLRRQSKAKLDRLRISDFSPAAMQQLDKLRDTQKLSRRAEHSMIQLARSLSVVDGCTSIRVEHIHEAFALRPNALV